MRLRRMVCFFFFFFVSFLFFLFTAYLRTTTTTKLCHDDNNTHGPQDTKGGDGDEETGPKRWNRVSSFVPLVHFFFSFFLILFTIGTWDASCILGLFFQILKLQHLDDVSGCYAFSTLFPFAVLCERYICYNFFIAICFPLFDLPMLFFVVDILFLVCLHKSSQLHTAAFY